MLNIAKMSSMCAILIAVYRFLFLFCTLARFEMGSLSICHIRLYYKFKKVKVKMLNTVIKYKKLNALAVEPKYAKAGDAGLDLYATAEVVIRAKIGRAHV